MRASITRRVLAWLLLPVLAVPGWAHGAQTAAGTLVTNQASADYFDEARGVPARAFSNTASIRVAPRYDARLEVDRITGALPGQPVNLAHTLTNTGNTVDSFRLMVENLTGDDFDLLLLQVIHDINGNGIADPGEPPLTESPVLSAGGQIPLVWTGAVPPATPRDAEARARIYAQSVNGSGVTVENNDTVSTGGGAILQLFKDAVPPCNVALAPGSTVTYTIGLTNVGLEAPAERSITVDGAPANGVLLEDEIPANVELTPLQAPFTAPAGARALVKRVGDPSGAWLSFAAWNGSGRIERVGMLVPATSLRHNQSGTLRFEVRTAASATEGTQVFNQAFIDVNGLGIPEAESNRACNTLAGVDENGRPNPAEIRFLEPTDPIRVGCTLSPTSCTPPDFANDDDFQDTALYRLDSFSGYQLTRDGIYLEVEASTLNSRSYSEDDEYSGQAILVRLESRETGDFLRVRVVETAPNSGRFRSLRPVRLSTTLSGGGGICPSTASSPDFTDDSPSCVLRSTSNDALRASISDPATGSVLVDASIVDPLGVVFDSFSLEPVAGAVVTVRCSGSGQPLGCVSGQVAPNPDSGGATPLAPQTTAADGRYQFPRMFPGDYYLDVAAPASYAFPSGLAPGLFTGIFEVYRYSYGRAGFAGLGSGVFRLNAGDPPLRVDIPVDPGLEGGLVISKEVTPRIAEPGDFVRYELRVRNNTTRQLNDTWIRDRLPYGFKYVPGSARKDETTLADPGGGVGPELVFDLGDGPAGRLEVGQEAVLHYVVQVSAGAIDGDGVNRAQAFATGGVAALEVNSGVAAAKVEVRRDGVLSDRAYIFGRVFVDVNEDDLYGPEDWAVGGVRIYLEDGTYLITDEHGQYSVYGIRPGLHVVKLDTTTLPPGAELKVLDNRHAGDPDNRFADVAAGELHRADFALFKPAPEHFDALKESVDRRAQDVNGIWMLEEAMDYDGEPELRGVLRDRSAEPASADGDISRGSVVGPELSTEVAAQPGTAPATPPVATPDFPQPEQAAATVTSEMAAAGTWLWPTNRIARDGRFVVVVRAGVTPVLLVNGEPVPTDKLGEQIENRATRAQVLGWYGVSLRPGENTVTVSATDPFGNLRKLADGVFHHPGPPRRLRLMPASDTLDADGGHSLLPIRVVLEDSAGVPVNGSHFVTIEASDGRWLEEDLQDRAPGHQIRLDDGEALVHLRSSHKAGEVKLQAMLEQRFEARRRISFLSPMRPLIGAGYVDITARFDRLSTDSIAPVIQADGFEDEVHVESRGALFLKGKVKGDMLLTLAYDTGKEDEDALFRDIDPEAYYPIYGDASAKGFEAQSRSKLYLRVERERNSLMWGDYRTDAEEHPALRDGLTRVQRALNGINSRVEDDGFLMQAYAARQRERRIVEELRGNGTATNYRVGAAPLVTHSETVDLVVRDRDNTGLVLDTDPLQRFSDYSLDEIDGFLRFNRAIPSRDENGNPVFIRITYLSRDDGEKHTVAGLRIAKQLGDHLTLGGTYNADQHPVDGNDMHSVFALYERGGHSLLTEVAGMGHEDASPGGNAARIKLDSSWDNGLTSAVTWSRAEEGFDNSSAGISAGRAELQADASYPVGDDTELRAEVIDSRSLRDDEKRSAVSLTLARRLGSLRVEGGVRHIHQRQSADEDRFNTARLRLEWSFMGLGRPAQVYGEAEQDLSGANRRSLQVGGEVQVHDQVKLYARHELINSLNGITFLSRDSRRSDTVVGVESSLIESTSSYSEYRMRDAIDGREMEAANGIRSGFVLNNGITLSPQLEVVRSIEGDGEGDFVSVSVGLADNREATRRSTMRVETRQGESSDFYALRASYAAKLRDDWTGFAKEDYALELPNDGNKNLRHALTLAVAHRPLHENQHHWLAMFQWKEERDGSDDDNRGIYLISTHHNLEVSTDLILAGRLGVKWQKTEFDGDSYYSDAELLDGRLLWSFHPRFDLDLRAGVLGTDSFRSLRHSLGAGLNYRVRRNLRVGAGYNLAGFHDEDLDGEGHNARGLYFSINAKFDEDLFDWIQ